MTDGDMIWSRLSHGEISVKLRQLWIDLDAFK